jgi:hypothetical protein
MCLFAQNGKILTSPVYKRLVYIDDEGYVGGFYSPVFKELYSIDDVKVAPRFTAEVRLPVTGHNKVVSFSKHFPTFNPIFNPAVRKGYHCYSESWNFSSNAYTNHILVKCIIPAGVAHIKDDDHAELVTLQLIVGKAVRGTPNLIKRFNNKE